MLYVLDITSTYIAVYGVSDTETSFRAIARYFRPSIPILESTTGENEIMLSRCTTEEFEAILGRVPASWNRANYNRDVYKILLPQ